MQTHHQLPVYCHEIKNVIAVLQYFTVFPPCVPLDASKEMKRQDSSFRLRGGLLSYYREAGGLLTSHVLVLVLKAAKVPLYCRKQCQPFVNQYLISNKTSLPYAENNMNPIL